MRIVHVVTLASQDGAYGGPLRVAVNQVGELRRRGHDVVLAAGWRGRSPAPREVDGVPVRLFPVRQLVPGAGFSGLFSPGLVTFLRERSAVTDVVHVHAGRDLVTSTAMAVARHGRVPYVVQTHGMVGVDQRSRARAMDALLVRRLLGSAARQLVLTAAEARDLPLVMRRPGRVQRLMNGVPLPLDPAAGGTQVLFCARLHTRKRPVAFVEMAGLLRDRGVRADHRIVGPDEGELSAVRNRVRDLGLAAQVQYEGALPYEHVLDRMRAAAVYVLPSVDEPFPMSLLEALSLGVPCVCTDSCGISDLLREHRAAIVTDGSPAAMAVAVEGLLADAPAREALGARGRRAVERVFSLGAVVDALEQVYGEVSEQGSPGARGRPAQLRHG